MARLSRCAILVAVVALGFAAPSAAGDEVPNLKRANPAGPGPVGEALARGGYPWYDAGTDSVKPMWPPREWDLDWLDRRLSRITLGGLSSAGSLLAYLLAMVGLSVLLFLLVKLWRQYQPGPEAPRLKAAAGAAARIESLPVGLRPETVDPWTEALACRARGDYARAVVCLFAHQLLTLDRLRHIRLAPSRTGRQLVRAIDDAQIQGWVDATLRLFEAVYYGHHIPSAARFEQVWSAAEAFERRIAAGATP
jgi:hypothetical protein